MSIRSAPAHIAIAWPSAVYSPRIRADFPTTTDTAGSQDNRLGLKDDKAPGFAPITKAAGDVIVIVFENVADRAFHKDIDALMDAAILQREGSSPSRCGRRRERAADKCGRRSFAAGCPPSPGAIEDGPPLLQFTHSVGSFLSMYLRHAPLIEIFAALHGVAKVGLPTVASVGTGERRGDAAFGP